MYVLLGLCGPSASEHLHNVAIFTAEISHTVLDSCQGSCTAFRGCPALPAAASSDDLSPGVIAANVISAIVGAVVVVLLLRRYMKNSHYDPVQGIEMTGYRNRWNQRGSESTPGRRTSHLS